MDQRLQFLTEYQSGLFTMTELAEQHRIARKTAHKCSRVTTPRPRQEGCPPPKTEVSLQSDHAGRFESRLGTALRAVLTRDHAVRHGSIATKATLRRNRRSVALLLDRSLYS
jgi:hypothetical protein